MEELKWYENRQGMKVNRTNGVTWLSFPALDKAGFIRHGFSTRLGGVSEGCYESMNLSFTRGDDPVKVHENFRRIGKAIGFSPESLVLSDQTHTANVRTVGTKDCGSGITRSKDFHDTDGLVTNTPGVTLATFYADCVPLFFADPVRRAVGLSHSGWRGTAARIGEVTLRRMNEEFGTRAEDVICCIGPSVCIDCYEVSSDVAMVFAEMFKKEKTENIFYKKENGKYQLNLWEANRRILMEAGVPDANITVAGLCTSCNPRMLYSHRKSGSNRGNLGAFIQIVKA
ncbi:MAG: peptidoglycan editing factor PgeF [Blautia sp.]|nr:peptidoglycan editing factor PgeF [Blautia sp.]